MLDSLLDAFRKSMDDVSQVAISKAEEGEPQRSFVARCFQRVPGSPRHFQQERMGDAFVIAKLLGACRNGSFENVGIDAGAVEHAVLTTWHACNADCLFQRMAKETPPSGASISIQF